MLAQTTDAKPKKRDDTVLDEGNNNYKINIPVDTVGEGRESMPHAKLMRLTECFLIHVIIII